MLREFWGVDEQRLDTFNWHDSMHPDDAPEIGRRMMAATSARTGAVVKGRYRNSNGEYRVLDTTARPRVSADGAFVGMIGVNVDITERERAEAARDLLLAEINHRVKNNLAVIQSIAHQTFRVSSTLAGAKEAFEGRLHALSRAHDLLTQESWEHVSLKDLVSNSLHAQSWDESRLSASGPRVLLPPRQALAAAMAFHELFTNAVKYGALSNETGHIEIQWERQSGDSSLALSWREREGPAVSEPTHRGFGSVLLARTFSDLNGNFEIEYLPEGVVCRIVMPLLPTTLNG
jgi:PAS domain S-box-containing protein